MVYHVFVINPMRKLMLTLLLLLLTMFGYVSAQDSGLPPLAAVTDGQITLYGLGGTRQITPRRLTPYANLVWSPDGQHLAYTAYTADFQPQIFLTTRGGAEPTLLVQQASVFPATFSADNARLLYAAPTDDPTILDVLSRSFDAQAQPENLGQIRFATGCGGGSPYPMDAIYNAEAGFSGSHLVFARTDFGIVHSLTCAGSGLAILDGGAIRELSATITRVALSPDQTRAAGVESGGIRIVNLENGEISTVGTQFTPDQIAWGGDNGTLYYSVRRLMDTPLPLAENEIQAMSQWMGLPDVSIPQYAVSIYRVSLGAGQESETYSGPGWAVGRMFASGSSLYFSMVPNGESWIEAITSGSIDPNSGERYFQERQSVAVTLFRANGNGGAVEVGSDIGQAALHPSGR